MKKASLPVNEQERLLALQEYDILNTLPEPEFDNITRIAATISYMPVSMINIIDDHRQHVKSYYGLAVRETKREHSFCAYAIDTPNDILVIPDLRKDSRFANHPFVAGKPDLVFYAGIPLVNPDGYALGALCVIDYKPGLLNAAQIENLRSLAGQVVTLLELRKNTRQLKQTKAEINYLNADLEKLSHIASHDLKSPLNNIISLTHLLLQEHAMNLDEEGNEYMNYLNDSAYRLSDMVSGIMIYARISQLAVKDKEHIVVAELIREITASLNIPETIEVIFEKDSRRVYTSHTALKQMLTHLIHNAIRYNDKTKGIIEVKFKEEQNAWLFEIKDNGPGIAAENIEKMFNLFERLDNKIKDGENLGIGLAITKRLIEKLGGEITVSSEKEKGTSFIVSIPK